MMKACAVCGRPTRGAPRCGRHPLAPRGYAYSVAARQTLAEETLCWLCGRAPTPDDPLVAAHIVARAEGGADARANMHAVHRSYNQRSGTLTLDEDAVCPHR